VLSSLKRVKRRTHREVQNGTAGIISGVHESHTGSMGQQNCTSAALLGPSLTVTLPGLHRKLVKESFRCMAFD